MVNATLVGSFTAMLVVVASVVAIATTLSAGTDGGAEALLYLPAVYTAAFKVVWWKADGTPSGYETVGTVSVDQGNMAFRIDSLLNGVHQVRTTYTDNLLFATDNALYNDCVSAQPDVSLALVAQFEQADVARGTFRIQPYTGNTTTSSCSTGLMYLVHAFYADHVLCVTNKRVTWIQGEAYTLTINHFFPGVAEPIDPPEGANMSLCTLSNDSPQQQRRRLGAGRGGSGHREHHGNWREKWAAEHQHHQHNGSHHHHHGSHHNGSHHQHPRALATAFRHVCFMHGMGMDSGPSDKNMVNAGAAYWGSVAAYVPGGAAYVHAIHVNTLLRGWTDPGLQDEYYEYIKTYKCDVVFAHSMGNVILAALAARRKPVLWYMTQGPLRGSWGASWADSVCAQSLNPLGLAANALGYCAGNGGNPAVKTLTVRNYHTVTDGCDVGTCPDSVGNSVAGWTGGAHEVSWSTCWHCTATLWGLCYAGYPAGMEVCADSGAYLVSSAESYIKGRMCGSSAYGQGGVNGLGLAAISALVNYGETTDGMVAMSSCAQALANKGQMLSPYPSSSDYALNGNHADGTCRSGNGATGDQMACTWFRNMIVQGTGSCPIPGYCANP